MDIVKILVSYLIDFYSFFFFAARRFEKCMEWNQKYEKNLRL